MIGVAELAALATRPPVMKRAFVTALVVGNVLALINHGHAIFSGEVNSDVALRISLTFMVPYCVSTTSSVLAALERIRDN